jgi:hypothetical protein
MAMSAKLQARVRAVARELAAEIQAEEGAEALDTKQFVQIEDQACQLGDSITTALIEAAAEQQAQQAGEAETYGCPRCGREAKRGDPEPRVLDTRRGRVAWQEPAYYCHRCRQSFFPSVVRFGD